MTYAYIRFSSSSQEETQQRFALEEYAKMQGLTIDEYEKDEGVSGGVSYRDRKLYCIVKKMRPGDTLITTEISRLGRSLGDINMLVNQELKPRKARLIVVKMGLDLDCSNLKAVDQMVLFAFGFAAECEKEMIVQRTQSALDARKEMLKEDGGFFSKSGRWCTHLGRAKGCDPKAGYTAGARANADKAEKWRKTSPLFLVVRRMVQAGRPRKEIVEDAQSLYKENPTAYCTRGGGPLTEAILCKWIRIIQKSI